MLERYDPEHSWHILILHRRVELSSLVEKFGNIREVEELGSKGSNASVLVPQIAKQRASGHERWVQFEFEKHHRTLRLLSI